MPLVRITAEEEGLRLFNGSAAVAPALRAALVHPQAGAGPVVVMIHGFKYRPGHPEHCPHRTILSLARNPQIRRNLSWPRHLGFGRGRPDEGLAVAFGWEARKSLRQACRTALDAGIRLAELVTLLRSIAPARPVHIVAHSLGARVALAAMARLAPGALDTVILLTGAEFTSAARAALDSPCGRGARVLNVTSRENDVFDFLMERCVAPPEPGDQMLGLGRLRAPNLVTLQLDDPATLAALRRAGFPLAAPAGRICHWSAYLRPGVFPLYRALLSGRLSLSQLRALCPDEPAPRWSRLRPQRLPALPLPFLARAS